VASRRKEQFQFRVFRHDAVVLFPRVLFFRVGFLLLLAPVLGFLPSNTREDVADCLSNPYRCPYPCCPCGILPRDGDSNRNSADSDSDSYWPPKRNWKRPSRSYSLDCCGCRDCLCFRCGRHRVRALDAYANMDVVLELDVCRGDAADETETENAAADDARQVSSEEEEGDGRNGDDGDGNRDDRDDLDLSPARRARSNTGRDGDDDSGANEAGSNKYRNNEDACLCRAENDAVDPEEAAPSREAGVDGHCLGRGREDEVDRKEAGSGSNRNGSACRGHRHRCLVRGRKKEGDEAAGSRETRRDAGVYRGSIPHCWSAGDTEEAGLPICRGDGGHDEDDRTVPFCWTHGPVGAHSRVWWRARAHLQRY